MKNWGRSRGLFVAAVLSSALVSGGWLVERGLRGTPRGGSDSGAHLLDQVLGHVARDFVDTLSDSALYTRTVDGLMGELHDPHSSYLSPRLLARLSESTSGRYAGVGAQVDVRDGWITIVAPLPGGPAVEAGIQTGDRVTEVDGKPMHVLSIEEARNALRGAPGSTIRLTIERPGIPAPIKFALTRREIRVHSAQHAMLLEDGVGYVALSIFSDQSAPDLRRAIDSLRTAGMKSLIFDLRGDPGGLLDEGVGVAELFLEPGQRIVSMRGRIAEASRTYSDQSPQPWPRLPMALLVDSNSASASEIVAGALQDHDRAVLLGTATYGKGSAQNVFPLANGGAVKLTTALWYTPSGRSINRKARSTDGVAPDSATRDTARYTTDGGRKVLGRGGITPDVILPLPKPLATDSILQRALGAKIPQFQDALTDYALSLKASHAVTSPAVVVTPAMRAELLRRMRTRGITIASQTYEACTPSIDFRLGYEITRYVFGEGAGFAWRLRGDSTVAAAHALLRGATTEQLVFDRAAARQAAAPPKP
ncbi:MAG: S41 family peptidase [bacterium]